MCEDNMLFSRVKMSCFRAKDHLVFHWCLYNKVASFMVYTFYSVCDNIFFNQLYILNVSHHFRYIWASILDVYNLDLCMRKIEKPMGGFRILSVSKGVASHLGGVTILLSRGTLRKLDKARVQISHWA